MSLSPANAAQGTVQLTCLFPVRYVKCPQRTSYVNAPQLCPKACFGRCRNGLRLRIGLEYGLAVAALNCVPEFAFKMVQSINYVPVC